MRSNLFLSQMLGLALIFSAFPGITIASDLRPGEKAQIYILLDFDGDPNFPSITWQHQTPGLNPFTGSILGLPVNKLAALKERIIELIKEDYAEFSNVHFVTSTEGLSFWYTWGIDDMTYVYYYDPDPADGNNPDWATPILRDQPCHEPNGFQCYRTYGKAGPCLNINEQDRFGVPIYHPLFARTFAGSFSIPNSGPNPSFPPLIYGDSYGSMGLPSINVENLAQALANNASHEIAHLFRLVHPPELCGPDCINDLMIQPEELWMARNNMRFVYPAGLEQLRKTLTEATTADFLEPNNDMTTASTISAQQLTLTLHDPFDEDFIKYIAPPTSGKILSLTVTHDFPLENQGLRRLLSVEVRKNSAVLPLNAISSGWQIIDDDVNPGDEYLIYIQQFVQRLPVQYRLQIGVGDDVFEANGGNNTEAGATVWPSSLVCDNSGLSIGNSSDVDYYRFNSLGGSIEAEVSYDPTYGDLELTIDGADAAQIISNGAKRYGHSLEEYTPLIIYDVDRNLTWLRQAGYSGRITYSEAIDLVNYSNSSNLLGGNSWRLPCLDIAGNCLVGFNCTQGELGHIFYKELDNIGGVPPAGGLTNRGPFIDLDASVFWYETREAVTNDPYVFNFFNGFQTTQPTGSRAYAWLVHDGNLAPLTGPRNRHVRMISCGSAASLIRLSGPPMLYNLCIRKISAREGCPGYIEWIPFTGTGSFDYKRQNPYSPGISNVTGQMQRGMFARILSEDATSVKWQIASWIDYGNNKGQPLQGSLVIPKDGNGADGKFIGLVIAQSGLTQWYQKTGNCVSGRTDIVNCNDNSQCDTSPGSGDGVCEPWDISITNYSGDARSISDFDVNTGIDAMYWNVSILGDRGTIVMQGALDTDGDCISDEIEIATGTDPYNDDSDNDGLLDGEEDINCDGVPDLTPVGGSSPESIDFKSGTNPRLFDTDGDGLSDGLECSLIRPHGIINNNPSEFVADMDPLTATNPTDPDTDGDGISDGMEDTNKNGRLDPNETSPLVTDTIIKPVEPRKMSLSMHGGVSLPTGNLTNVYRTGFNLMLDVDYHFSNQLSLVVLLGYNGFKAKTTSSDDNYWINISANLRYYKPLIFPWSVYFGCGPGLYIPGNGNIELGANLGLGINYAFNNLINFELGADYHTLFGSGSQFTQSHIGIVLRF